MTEGIRYELRCPKDKRLPATILGLVFGCVAIVLSSAMAFGFAKSGNSSAVRIVGPLFSVFVGLMCVEFFGFIFAIGRIHRIEIDARDMVVVGSFGRRRIAIDDVERIECSRRYPRLLGVVPIVRAVRMSRVRVIDRFGRKHLLCLGVELFEDENSGKNFEAVMREVLGAERCPAGIAQQNSTTGWWADLGK